jgi:hypothetical protein
MQRGGTETRAGRGDAGKTNKLLAKKSKRRKKKLTDAIQRKGTSMQRQGACSKQEAGAGRVRAAGNE